MLDSYGSAYLAYREVDPSYPGWSALSREMDEAMLDLLDEMLAERTREDPELRISTDDRCVMWEWHDMPAGTLPHGTRIEYKQWTGVLRPASLLDLQYDGHATRLYADLVPRWHYNPFAERPGCDVAPRIEPDTIVSAKLPVPLDRGALLAIIDAETGHVDPPTGPSPRPRVSWDDIKDGQVIRYRHITRGRRLAGRPFLVRRGRVMHVSRPGPGVVGHISIAVLNKNGTINRNIRYHSLFDIDDVVSVEPTPGGNP